MGSYSIGERLNYLKENSFGDEDIGSILVHLVGNEKPRDLHENWDNYRGELGKKIKGGLNKIITKLEQNENKGEILKGIKQFDNIDKKPKTKAYYENIRTMVYNIKSKSKGFPNGFFKDVADCFFMGCEEAKKSGVSLRKEYENALGRLATLYKPILTREDELE